MPTEQHEQETSQRIYYINCPKCGEIVKVVNPRIKQEPTRVSQVSKGLKSDEYVGIACSACKTAFGVYLSYGTSPKKRRY
jgi:hypothetical protein